MCYTPIVVIRVLTIESAEIGVVAWTYNLIRIMPT